MQRAPAHHHTPVFCFCVCVRARAGRSAAVIKASLRVHCCLQCVLTFANISEEGHVSSSLNPSVLEQNNKVVAEEIRAPLTLKGQFNPNLKKRATHSQGAQRCRIPVYNES